MIGSLIDTPNGALRRAPRQHRRIAAAARWLLAVACLVSQGAVADQQGQTLKRVKAAFVLNIARFVTWPEQVYRQRPDQLRLCYYRQNPLGSAFETIRGKTVEGRRLEKLAVEHLADAGVCDILLVPSAALQALETEAHPGFDLPLLTIADTTDRDTRGKAYEGILITLVRRGQSIGFEINLDKANEVGLKMSSELLKLSQIVGNESR